MGARVGAVLVLAPLAGVVVGGVTVAAVALRGGVAPRPAPLAPVVHATIQGCCMSCLAVARRAGSRVSAAERKERAPSDLGCEKRGWWTSEM